MYADGDWQAVEGVLTKDMATEGEYLQTWKLKLSTTKTMSAAFHLKNKEAKRELKVKYNNETLPFFSEPKYLGVTLDRSLTYRQHLDSLRKKLTTRVALLRRLASSGWGAGATSLRVTTLALAHSAAEYCAPDWCRSAHTRLIDPAINDALRIVTGCLRPTPADMGVRRGQGWALASLDFEIFSKKVVFLFLGGKKTNFTTFATPEKFWKNRLVAHSWKNRRPCRSGQPSNPRRHPTYWASSQWPLCPPPRLWDSSDLLFSRKTILEMGVHRNFSGGGKVNILLISFSLLAMQRKWTYTKRKCPMLRQQLHAVFSL